MVNRPKHDHKTSIIRFFWPTITVSACIRYLPHFSQPPASQTKATYSYFRIRTCLLFLSALSFPNQGHIFSIFHSISFFPMLHKKDREKTIFITISSVWLAIKCFIAFGFTRFQPILKNIDLFYVFRGLLLFPGVGIV